MKKKIQFLAAALLVTMVSATILGIQSANANVAPETGTKKFISCTISEEGQVIMVGGRCDSGTHACIANPCY